VAAEKEEEDKAIEREIDAEGTSNLSRELMKKRINWRIQRKKMMITQRKSKIERTK
jgi:hypothetical protein